MPPQYGGGWGARRRTARWRRWRLGPGGGPGDLDGPEPLDEPEGEEPGPAVVVGPGDGGVRISRRGRAPMPTPEPESWYRSSSLEGPARRGDTGEIPVVPTSGEDTDEVPLYPPRHWVD